MRLRHQFAALGLWLVAGVASAQSLPACGSGQQPFQFSGGLYPSATPALVCHAYVTAVSASGWRLAERTDSSCLLVNNASGAYNQTAIHKVCEPSAPHWSLEAPGLTATKVADYMQLFGLFLTAAVVVLAAKSLYNRFRIDPDHV